MNPNADQVEGLKSYPDLASLPETMHGVCIITPPEVTETIVEQAGRLGVEHLWLQPGAESKLAVDQAEQSSMNIVSGGPCILIALGYRE